MHETNREQPNLIVYRGWLDQGEHVWSPFVIKLEARLRFAGISYSAEAGSTLKAPKGKIPYIEYQEPQPDPINGSQPTTPGDSTLIIKNLFENNILPDINAKASSAAQAQDLAIRALLEDKLYFYHTKERWVEHYYEMRDHILSGLPFPMRVIVGLLIYRKICQTLNGQGTLRYSRTEMASFREEIWKGVNALLVSVRRATTGAADDQPFWVLGGTRPTEADATLFAFIVSVLVCTVCPESQSVVKGFPVIVEYTSRIQDVYFPDYEKWV